MPCPRTRASIAQTRPERTNPASVWIGMVRSTTRVIRIGRSPSRCIAPCSTFHLFQTNRIRASSASSGCMCIAAGKECAATSARGHARGGQRVRRLGASQHHHRLCALHTAAVPPSATSHRLTCCLRCSRAASAPPAQQAVGTLLPSRSLSPPTPTPFMGPLLSYGGGVATGCGLQWFGSHASTSERHSPLPPRAAAADPPTSDGDGGAPPPPPPPAKKTEDQGDGDDDER
jgi:hypothetical protein